MIGSVDHMDAIIALTVVGGFLAGGWYGTRGLERAFQLFGDYAAGPRAYPDQDPAPAGA